MWRILQSRQRDLDPRCANWFLLRVLHKDEGVAWRKKDLSASISKRTLKHFPLFTFVSSRKLRSLCLPPAMEIVVIRISFLSFFFLAILFLLCTSISFGRRSQALFDCVVISSDSTWARSVELSLTLQEKEVFAERVLGVEMGFCGSCQSWEIVVCTWWLSSPSQRHYSPLDDCFHFPFHHRMLCTWQEGCKKNAESQNAAGNPGDFIDFCTRCALKVDGRDRRRRVRQGLCSWREALLVSWSHGCQGRHATLLPEVVSSLAVQNLLCPSTAPKGQESLWIKVWGQELRMEEKSQMEEQKRRQEVVTQLILILCFLSMNVVVTTSKIQLI